MKYKKALIFAITLLCCGMAFCQDKREGKFNSHNIRIYYEEESALQAKELFVTTDGGKSWKNAESIGKVSWEKDGKGANALFTAPSDGIYGFAYVRFGDNLTAIEAPKSGETPELSALVDTIPPVVTVKGAEQIASRKEISTYFDASDANGVAEIWLWVTNDGGKSWNLAPSSKVFEDEKGKYVTFSAADYGTYGFICQAIDTVGNKSCTNPQAQAKPDVEITVAAYESSKPDIASAKEHYQRGVLLTACDKTEQAIKELEKATALWSNYKDALNSVASIYYEKGNYNKALEYFIRARKSDPSDPVGYVNAALAYSKLNLKQEALQELQDSIELGLDKKKPQLEEAEITASEILWQVAKEALEAKDEKTATAASNLILKIPFSTPQTRSNASSISAAYKKSNP